MRYRLILPVIALLAAGCADRHSARGLVLKVDHQAGVVTVSHDAIPGLMDDMVMPFTASEPAELTDVKAGDVISFRLTVRPDGSTVDRIAILSAAPADSGLILSPAKPTLASLNQQVPDFTLTDQDRLPVTLSALRGRAVVIAFIYTRCPLPDYCPRVLTNLGALRERFAGRIGTDLTLLTVTFDPTHDTPDVLKAYAQRHGADLPGWRFLTGTPAEIARVCSLFGVEYWSDEGLITHTLQTAVIDREGRLAATAEGKSFTPRQLGDLVELSLGAGR